MRALVKGDHYRDCAYGIFSESMFRVECKIKLVLYLKIVC